MGLILAIDIGKGTEDVMLHDPAKSLENAIQLVLPSTAQILAKSISNARSNRIFISGELMAGEPWHKEVYSRCEKIPESVIMTETAALSLRYNLDQVRHKGVKIIPDKPSVNFIGDRFTTYDVDWLRIQHILQRSKIKLEEISTVLLCAQDHGLPKDPGQSTRDFRMKTIYSRLDKSSKLEDLLLQSDQIPDNLPRHQALSSSALTFFSHLPASNIFVMDSSPAVALGAITKTHSQELIINVGNGHTLAVFIINGLVELVYELHTGSVNAEKILMDLEDILSGDLTHEKSLEQGGHGIYQKKGGRLTDISLTDFEPITLIGPHRGILKTLNVDMIHPGGSMMMAGPVGLIRAYQYQRNRQE